jgi:hypothetical protein
MVLVSFGLGGMTLGRARNAAGVAEGTVVFLSRPMRLSHDLFARTVRLERPETCPNLSFSTTSQTSLLGCGPSHAGAHRFDGPAPPQTRSHTPRRSRSEPVNVRTGPRGDKGISAWVRTAALRPLIAMARLADASKASGRLSLFPATFTCRGVGRRV